MKFSYLFYDPIPDLGELDVRMRALAALGYHGIELSASHPMPYPTDAIRRLAEKHRLPVVSFLSGWSYSNEHLCLASPDSAIRDRAIERLSSYADLAAQLGALLVVGLMQGLRTDEPDTQLAAARIAECLRRVATSAESCGGSVVLEPVNHLQVGFHHTAAEAAALAARIASLAFGYMLDTFHMNIEEIHMRETILTHGHGIRHFHLCETNGGPFGSGHLDVSGVLAALDATGYARFVSVKVYRALDWHQSAHASAEILRATGFF
jgi:sugar phosphate isomerase/epimerase